MANNKNITKISFIGDIMCEKPFLQAWKNQKNKNVFDDLYIHMEEDFKKSDYIVGNLETICAGEELGYTNHIYSFNTPNEFIESIKKSGINLVTTATNHSLDRGIEGLIKNIEILEANKLKYIGTYSKLEESKNLFIEEIKGLNVAFLNYTYGTNLNINEIVLRKEELKYINLLKPQDEDINKLMIKRKSKGFKNKVASLIFKFITLEQWIKAKKILGLKYNEAYQDNSLAGIDQNYLEMIKNEIKQAKDKSDLVIMCMHSGGQFNPFPGKFTEYMMNFMSENGVDVVIGNHPHVVQKFEEKDTGMIAAYSLGNFSISPSSVYVLHENLPEYSIMFHIYLDVTSKKIVKKTFTILKIVENKDFSLKVYPLKKLIEETKNKSEQKEIIANATQIYNHFLNKNIDEITIKEEYII